jgi:hypothetical protein
MNFALLWTDGLIVALLWVAAVAAFVGRIRRRWVRGLLTTIILGPPLFLLGTFVWAAATMRFAARIEPDWFNYSVSLLVAFLIGASWILRRGRRGMPGFASEAATWQRTPLMLALAGALAVGVMTLLNMDLAIRARCAIQSLEVNSIYLATLPAITSDAQNAAPIYEKAMARLRDAQKEEEEIQNPPTGNRDTFDPAEPATIAFLREQAGTIAMLRQAAALPGCRFDRDLGNPDIALMLPTLNEVRNGANVLALHAREEIVHGNISSAMVDGGAILRMGRHFGERPLMISALVGIGIDALGNKTVEQALSGVTNQNELAGLRLEELSSLGRMFQQALRGEERYGLTILGNMPGGQMMMVKGKIAAVQDTRILSSGAGLNGAFFRVFFVDSDAYMKLMEHLQELAIQPYYRVRDDLTDDQGIKYGRGLFTSMMVASLSRVFESVARVEAGDECMRTAVAMTRFRLDHGKLPAGLSELVPDYLDGVPMDPFDGHPIRLVIKGDKWIIYSVGLDGVDDGGVEMVGRKGDVVFTLNSVRMAPTTR